MLINITGNFKKGDYLDAVLKGNDIIFSKEGKKLGLASAKGLNLPKGRKLKAVVKKASEGECDVTVLRFADLHRHSGYSLLDGASKIEDIVERTEYAGALTDHGNMFGFLKYYKAMRKAGKQPIVGFEAYTETIGGKKDSNHLLLLAKNEKGYKNLVKLTTMAYDNFYRKPHISYQMLEEHAEGLIVTTACIGGEIPQLLKDGNDEKAMEVALWFKKVFGDDFYIEIQRHDMGTEEIMINSGLMKLADTVGIKLVATTDSHYTLESDKEMHEILLCMQTGKTMNDGNRMKFSGTGYHIHTAVEMENKFSDVLEALDNTLEIAEKCSGFKLELDKLYLPEFKVPEGHTEGSYFEELVWNGFNERFAGQSELTNPVYLDRLKYEIGVIEQMGYSAYFLIVSDFIAFAKSNGIMVGPGRGSAVGSLASYCMSITDLDPIPYGLLFERFLNPERVSMPDIDVDFCEERRGEVIDYVKGKYGEKAVSKIITFGTLGAKSVVRDVARVLDLGYGLGDRIAKAIPADIGMTLKKAMEVNPEFQNMYDNESDVKMVIELALKLEGLPRHASVHACGIVIAASDVDNYLPTTLMENKNKVKETTAQVTMSEVEELGLLKMDFLGLRTMTVIDYAVKSINLNDAVGLKYLDIPNNDPYVYSDIAKGKTYGVFQLESPGMRKFMSELYADVDMRIKRIEKKHKAKGFSSENAEFKTEMKAFGQELFERLIAGVSLYRPGPMDYIPNYIQGMINPSKIVYETPELEPILKSTYGTIVYQEQVMQIVQALAGYSLGRADLVRRAMGKKKISVMNEEKNYFINGKLDKEGKVEVLGCINRGIPESVALSIWDKMEDFSKYAFNKSHAAAYAVLAVTTGWLKNYYPVDFMAATMNSFIKKADKLKSYLSVCKDMDITILPPNTNKSSEMFARSVKDIIFGIKGIRNMGSTSNLIIAERDERGVFEDFQDFATRMAKYQRVNKKVLEGLVYAGALDSFEGTRKAKISIIPTLLTLAASEKKTFESGQITLFELNEDISYANKVSMPVLDEFEKRHKLDKEKEYAGFYVTEHPMDEYSKYFKSENITEIGFLTADSDEEEEGGIKESYNKLSVTLAGIVKEIHVFYTKKDNKPINIFTLEGTSGEIKCVVFADKLEANRQKIMEGKIVLLKGEIKEDDRGIQCIVNSIVDIESLEKTHKQEPRLIAFQVMNEQQLNLLNDEILGNKQYLGTIPVYIVMNGKKYKSKKSINREISTLSKLDNLFGNNYKIVD